MCPAEYTEHDVRRAQVERAVVVQSSALLARLPEAFRHIQHALLGLWQQQQQQVPQRKLTQQQRAQQQQQQQEHKRVLLTSRCQ